MSAACKCKMNSAKEALFSRLKQRGLFWSYAPQAQLGDLGDANFMETCLRYGDWPDWKQLVTLYPRNELIAVWQERIKPDVRFKKQNLLIARVLFGLDVEASHFDEARYDRDTKLRFLAR